MTSPATAHGSPATAISLRQLRRLQTLWGLHWKQVTRDPRPVAHDSREARIGWLAGIAGRQLSTSKELTRDEAARAIDELQKALPPDAIRRTGRGSRATAYGPGRARAMGTAGRRTGHGPRATGHDVIDMVDAPTLELLATLKAKLGWDQARLEAFLRSPSSPLAGRTEISTLGQANAVIWALKAILRRAATGDQRPALNHDGSGPATGVQTYTTGHGAPGTGHEP